MPIILPTAFFDRPTVAVAESLLGKVLVYQNEHTVQRAIITEVEAYDGPRDKACHAHHGRTERNAPMFGLAGHWYIYFIYGMYWMLNIVSGKEGYPAAILIRGACLCHPERSRRATPHLSWFDGACPETRVPWFDYAHHDTRKMTHRRAHHDTALDGPGKLTRALGIDGSFNAKKSAKDTGLWIEDAYVPIPQRAIQRTPRIGVDYAGPLWALKPYRFVLRSTPKCIQGVVCSE